MTTNIQWALLVIKHLHSYRMGINKNSILYIFFLDPSVHTLSQKKSVL